MQMNPRAGRCAEVVRGLHTPHYGWRAGGLAVKDVLGSVE